MTYQTGKLTFTIIRAKSIANVRPSDTSGGWWSKYDPETNSAPGLFLPDDKRAAEADDEASEAGGEEDPTRHRRLAGPENRHARTLDTDPDDEDEDFTTTDHHLTNGTSIFNNLVPPSAESLMEGAPAPVVEGELRRLLMQFNAGLGELAGAFEVAAARAAIAQDEGREDED